METAAYLERIDFTGPIQQDFDTLERLQRAHLTAVPFENLDVCSRRGVSVDPDVSTSKIVERGRGGWCYELNGAFRLLLVALGFEARLLAATVRLDDAGRPQPDHAAIEVIADRPYLVDVGFGDSFIRPLPLDTAEPDDQGAGIFRLLPGGEYLMQQGVDGRWTDRYRFPRHPVANDEFKPCNRFLQQDGNGWTDKPFATRLLDGGPDRVTLLSDRIKFRRDGVWKEAPVAPEHWDSELQRWFGMSR